MKKEIRGLKIKWILIIGIILIIAIIGVVVGFGFFKFTGNAISDVSFENQSYQNITGQSLNLEVSSQNQNDYTTQSLDGQYDRNISVVAGWNLIGYSSSESLDVDNIIFTNSTGSQMSLSTAVTNGQLHPYFAYYDSSSPSVSQRKYKYSALSSLTMDDSKLSSQKGYWVYSNENGTLTLPGVGGTLSGQNYLSSNLRFSNGTMELSVSDAIDAEWIDGYAYYWNPNAKPSGAFVRFALDEPNNMTSWKGYFIRSLKDNITLIRQN